MRCVSICKMCSLRESCLLRYCTKKFLLRLCPESVNNITHLATALNLEGSEMHRIPQKAVKKLCKGS